MRRSPGAYRWLSPRSDAELCQGSSSASGEHMSSPSVCNTSLANNTGGRTPVVGRFAPIRMLGPGALEPSATRCGARYQSQLQGAARPGRCRLSAGSTEKREESQKWSMLRWRCETFPVSLRSKIKYAVRAGLRMERRTGIE